MMYGYGYGHAAGLGFGLFGGLLSLIFWIAVIWLIVGLIRSHRHGHCAKSNCSLSGWGNSDSAMDILRDRYAKGEITKEEFDQMSQTLKNA